MTMKTTTLAIALLFVGVVANAAEPKASDCPDVKELFRIASAKYPHLVLDEKLCKDSQKWADHLASTGRFHHGEGVRENIARGYKTCDSAMRGWFKSRGHNQQFKRNKRVGFGVQASGKMRYWVARFR